MLDGLPMTRQSALHLIRDIRTYQRDTSQRPVRGSRLFLDCSTTGGLLVLVFLPAIARGLSRDLEPRRPGAESHYDRLPRLGHHSKASPF